MTHRGPFQPLPFCDSVITERRVGRGEGACTRVVVALPGADGRMGHAAGRWGPAPFGEGLTVLLTSCWFTSGSCMLYDGLQEDPDVQNENCVDREWVNACDIRGLHQAPEFQFPDHKSH